MVGRAEARSCRSRQEAGERFSSTLGSFAGLGVLRFDLEVEMELCPPVVVYSGELQKQLDILCMSEFSCHETDLPYCFLVPLGNLLTYVQLFSQLGEVLPSQPLS